MRRADEMMAIRLAVWGTAEDVSRVLGLAAPDGGDETEIAARALGLDGGDAS